MSKIASMDVIILSNAHVPLLKQYTDETILTCIRSDHNVDFNFVVIEEQKHIEYAAPTFHSDEPFNYNKFMNFGISKGNSEYIALCNNDLLFGRNWASNIITTMRRHEILSACPFEPQHHPHRKRWSDINYGYAVTMEMAGWCIVLKRSLLEIIGEIKWHPDLPFWYSDNIYARQLEKHGIKHALIKNSLVTHRGSQTIKRKENNEQWTSGSWPLFDTLCRAGEL